jgi:hypothetical protein
MAALTDSEILEQYKLARDAIVMAIAEGRSVIEYQVMSQRRKSTDPVAALRVVESQIAFYDQKVANAASAAGGGSRASTTGVINLR